MTTLSYSDGTQSSYPITILVVRGKGLTENEDREGAIYINELSHKCPEAELSHSRSSVRKNFYLNPRDLEVI